ncbi:Site-specific tyrosine recombinase [hydrothermal vent metagenome]|uniref:Site-specific tyrosine recombinase n=1 Tax=hydrothermal vent metagenome TaxID=652676 RepID=A0A3B0Z8D8_9ZZZZ
MTTSIKTTFKHNLKAHHNHLKLKGLQPKTIEAYMRAIRRIGEYFQYDIVNLSESQLLDYFTDLQDSHSWSAVKLDLYGLKFYTHHVLKADWIHVDLIKPPTATRLPDIVSVEEAAHLFSSTHVLSYRVFFFTLYSLGLRLGEGLNLEISDMDATHRRVHIRDAKGNKDRFVPLPLMTLQVLRHFWSLHRHPRLLFPNRKRGLAGSRYVKTPLDRGGVQATMRKVVHACGLKKILPPIACVTATRHI